MKLEDVTELVLQNGATLKKIGRHCTQCEYRRELPFGTATFEVIHKIGKTVYLCDAHAQKLLEMDSDIKEQNKVAQETTLLDKPEHSE